MSNFPSFPTEDYTTSHVKRAEGPPDTLSHLEIMSAMTSLFLWPPPLLAYVWLSKRNAALQEPWPWIERLAPIPPLGPSSSPVFCVLRGGPHQGGGGGGGGERVEGSFGEKLGEARFKGRKMFFCCDFDGKAGSQGK